MKTLTKKISIIGVAILVAVSSVKSIYADGYSLTSINATSKKTIELELNNNINRSFNESDLEVYKPFTNNPLKLGENQVLLELNDNLEKNSSYSILSTSGLNGSIIFDLGEDFIGKEIKNNDLENEKEGIEKIKIKDANHIEIIFIQKVEGNLEFQLLKSLKVDSLLTITNTNKIKATLNSQMQDNSQYLGTISYISAGDSKIDISDGVKYFQTKKLAEYTGPSEEELKLQQENDKALQEELLKQLDESGKINDKEKEVLNSAKQDLQNKETQLEKLALSQKQTPETGAETWIILFLTLIINTFYFLSRKKKYN